MLSRSPPFAQRRESEPRLLIACYGLFHLKLPVFKLVLNPLRSNKKTIIIKKSWNAWWCTPGNYIICKKNHPKKGWQKHLNITIKKAQSFFARNILKCNLNRDSCWVKEPTLRIRLSPWACDLDLVAPEVWVTIFCIWSSDHTTVRCLQLCTVIMLQANDKSSVFLTEKKKN